MSVVIETTIGDITVDLFIRERPQTCRNFLKLCKIKYYNHCQFHFIQKDFIAQTGDPTGTGSGGESVWSNVHGNDGKFFQSEMIPKIKHNRAGLISMVNNGENLHGSQFFFTLGHSLEYLDKVHSVFGEVVEGMDIIMRLNDVISDHKNRPYQDILISHTVILDDPYPEIDGLQIPDRSPEYDFEDLLKTDRIGVGEELFDEEKPPEIIEEEIKDKEAKQRALVLEMIGDIPDAECAPPENVLFVCKLNPITSEEDLEIIFSRFGRIVSCEVIKDDKTGNSLQYAFIEFENKEDCEKAYFKMDNVLIDDRRIHVDFSQSVSKIRWKGKGRIQYQDDKGDWSNNKQKYKPSTKVDHDDRLQWSEKSTSKQRKASERSPSPERSQKYSRSLDKQRKRSRTPERSRKRSPTPERSRKRSRTPERSRRRSRTPEKSRSKRSRTPEKNRRKRSRTPDKYRRRSRSRDRTRRRSRTPEKSRRRSRSPDHHRRR